MDPRGAVRDLSGASSPLLKVLPCKRSTNFRCSIECMEVWAEVSTLVRTVGGCGCSVTGMDLLSHNSQDNAREPLLSLF